MDAMQYGHTEVLELLRSNGADSAAASKFVGMICHAAANNDSGTVLRLIEENSVDVNSADYDQRTGLHVAAALGYTDVVRTLLYKNADISLVDRWGQTAKDGAYGQCVSLLSDPVDRSKPEILAKGTKRTKKNEVVPVEVEELNAATKELLDAAAQGELKTIMALAKRGGNCACMDYDRRTPLHLAATGGHLQVLRFLVGQKGVSVNCTDRFGSSPLQDAAKHGFESCSKFLLSHGATAMDQRSGFTLCDSAAKADLSKLKELQLRGVDLATSDYDGRTALHLAAVEGHVKEVEWLLAQPGVKDSINAVDCMQQTPYDAALASDKGTETRTLIANAGGISWEKLMEGVATESLDEVAPFSKAVHVSKSQQVSTSDEYTPVSLVQQ